MNIKREEALSSYYKDPSVCQHCGQIIGVKDKQKINEVKKKKFCDRSCAAKYNNSAFPKRNPTKVVLCKNCGKEVKLTPRSNSVGGYIKREFCNECKHLNIGKSGKYSDLGTLTKGELKELFPTSWRSLISYNARCVYLPRGLEEPNCYLCDYDSHVDVCHIKAVSKFGASAKIEEINSPDNLVFLCPNHHWDMDHGKVCVLK